jgi:hypothetical protein
VRVVCAPSEIVPVRISRHCTIDSFGVREAFCFGNWRAYRLSDSHDAGWERIATEFSGVARARVRSRAIRLWGPRTRGRLDSGGAAQRSWLATGQRILPFEGTRFASGGCQAGFAPANGRLAGRGHSQR